MPVATARVDLLAVSAISPMIPAAAIPATAARSTTRFGRCAGELVTATLRVPAITDLRSK